MQQIIKFIEKYRYFLLFLLLEFVALFFTIQSHSFHRSKFVNSANSITGGIYKKANNIGEFFKLKKENERLSEENARLKNLLSSSIDTTTVDFSELNYLYSKAKIYNNNYTKRNNYLTIDKGSNDGVLPEMGVVNSLGIIGITHSNSNNFSTVISILNKHFMVNAKIENDDHFGSISWDGKDYRIVQLNDLPRQAIAKVGDTVITGGKSTIFPEGILIGTVNEIDESNTVHISLFNDMSSLSNVHIIKINLRKRLKL